MEFLDLTCVEQHNRRIKAVKCNIYLLSVIQAVVTPKYQGNFISTKYTYHEIRKSNIIMPQT